jgi:hypothetical protein
MVRITGGENCDTASRRLASGKSPTVAGVISQYIRSTVLRMSLELDQYGLDNGVDRCYLIHSLGQEVDNDL